MTRISEEKRPISANLTDTDHLLHGKPWENMSIAGALPPLALTVTSIDQSHELEKSRNVKKIVNQTSSDWLAKNCLQFEKLTLEDLMKQGILMRSSSQVSDTIPHLKFEEKMVKQFELKLRKFIEECEKHIDWLMKGSRKIFGFLNGKRLAVLLDASKENFSDNRVCYLKQSLQELINEQFVSKEQLYFLSFGSKPEALWEASHDVNCRIINELRKWVHTLEPSEGCNLLNAIRQVIKRKNIDSIVIILGRSPDQNVELICDYVKQSLAGRYLPFHTVSYCSNDATVDLFLKELAELTGGKYHCYSNSSNDRNFTGTDIQLLLNEIKRAKEILLSIEEMRRGRLGEKIITISRDRPRLAVVALTNENTKKRYLKSMEDCQLNVEKPSFPARASRDWLKQHGLKGRGLNLYQVLAPNSYSSVKGYVLSINKNVKSKVYNKSMTQFSWHDGTIKNVHVDPTMLNFYQDELNTAVQRYLRRIEWLTTGCRKIFGTLVEQRVIVMLDLSLSSRHCFETLKRDLKILFEQQMANKKYFNVICFNSTSCMFRTSMVNPSKKYLQEMWRWFLLKSCSGSRNFLQAFRTALENNEDLSNKNEVQGIYVISTGLPDSNMDTTCSFIKESLAGRDITLNTIYYEDDTNDCSVFPGRYACGKTNAADCLKQMAHSGRGRFHWYNSNDNMVECDDVTEIHNELNKAYNYSQKTTMLLETVKSTRHQQQIESCNEKSTLPLPAPQGHNPLPPPKQTALSQARLNVMKQQPSTTFIKRKHRPKTADAKSRDVLSLKPLSWKPIRRSSSSSVISDRSRTRNNVKLTPEVQRQLFYTEVGNSIGSILKESHNATDGRSIMYNKLIRDVYIPEKDENLSTREWMRKYSISKLKLDLDQLVGGKECSHSKTKVTTINKTVPARYCDIFPTIEVKGVAKHLHLTSRDLQEYEEKMEKVLKRYVKRMQWLMSGSRRVFGSVIESKIMIMIDTSCAMINYIDEIKSQLTGLIWEQLRENNIMFNVMTFNDEPTLWRPNVVAPSEENCLDAVRWIETFKAYGEACIVEAFRAVFQDEQIKGIYLVTQGNFDISSTMLLRELARLNNTRQIKVHTISFNFEDSSVNKFLQLLASQTNGRFHRTQSEAAGHLFAHRLLAAKGQTNEILTVPVFEGDDLKRLVHEISLCRKFLLQARSYRALLYEHSQKIGEINSPPNNQYPHAS
ncbi:von Willebrand factor A domain-containing protein 3A-like [Xenia sp. Carnegie-2017]|uniref:von Willebrand factor A domain-containing protein 3A-like n=1 Tax=Xenia sp. Carnegie-2017 TaxID=2897299 RepID=UPI001F03762B|nr:von Willebrand factor A domain-containing protein 3A-like [Xenia sp. Carnegie-2017]